MTSFCGGRLLGAINLTFAEGSLKGVRRECIADMTSLLLGCIQAVVGIALLVWLRLHVIRKCPPHESVWQFKERTSRWILTLSLIAVTFLEMIEGIVSYHLTWRTEFSLNVIITPLISWISAVIAAIYYQKVEEIGYHKMLFFLLMYWPSMAVLKICKLLILYENAYSIHHFRLQLTWSVVILYSLLSGVEVTVLLQERYFSKESGSDRKATDLSDIKYRHKYVSLFSKATFFWMVPLLRLGYQRPLEMADLGRLPKEETAEYQFDRFNEVFHDEKNKAESQMKKISLWRCYWRTFWPTLAVGGVLKVVGDMVGLIGPLSISVILAYVDNVQKGQPQVEGQFVSTWEFLQNGYVMAGISLVGTFLQSTFSNNFNHMAILEGIHLKSALQCLVYRKSLVMSTADLESGTVVNHMSTDTYNMMMLFSMGHYIWAVPFKIVLLLILLYMQLGYSALIGAATIYVLAPLQYKISSKLSKIQKKALDISDERLKRTTELLQGMKLLKLYGWEEMYGKLIADVREKELKLMRQDAIYVALNTFITQASSIVVTLVTFAIFSELEGRNLSPSEVFTGLALFNQLTVPLYIIPFVIPIVINATVSTNRLRDFFSQHEVERNVPWREKDIPAMVEFKPDSGSVFLHVYDRETERLSNPFIFESEADGVFLSDPFSPLALTQDQEGHQQQHLAICIQDGSFTWDPQSRSPVLKSIDLEINSGKLTLVVGNVGSGKTSLLCALLGELTVTKGLLKWSSTAHNVAYVPQKPWLVNATLKENILFGQPYDGRRYHQIIQACALQPDIDLLPAKDLTEIGERGINLSGGQRQRVALARAFYSQSRTLLLDDSLSALDVHVSNHIFEQGIKTLLLRRHRTVIMVTNKMEHLPHAHKVIFLDKQSVRYQGSLSVIEKLDREAKLLPSWNAANAKQDMQLAEMTTRERHKLERMFSRQVLYRPTSTVDVRRKTRLISFGRQMSHDPSSPLPCQDCDETDNPWSFSPSSVSSYNPIVLSHGASADSVHTKSSSSSGVFLRHSWRRPPSRHNSRLSGHTSDLIEEENEEDVENDLIDKEASQCDGSSILASGRLMSEEERERGQISKVVYLQYMRACSLPLALTVGLLMVLTQGVKVAADFWLSEWSNAARNGTNTTTLDMPIMQHYMIGYAAFSACGIFLALVTNLTAQLTTLNAVRFLHSQMLQNIVKCPMKFFDTTPLGRIINRFSSDINVIDKKLPMTLPVLLRFLLLCVSAIVVDVVVTPYFLLLVLPILAVYYFIQHFFRYSSRELQRLDSITKSPIFSHFSETISGLTTIRAFHEESRFTDQLNKYINSNNAAFIIMNSSNCWLGVSLDYLGGIILFLATISAMTAAILGEATPAFVGMSMAYTLLVPIYLNWVVRNLANVEMYMNGVERVQAYSRLPIENYLGDLDKEISAGWPAAGEICFREVTLKYDTAQEAILKNVTLTIKPGEKVGICGRTGSGKSSLAMSLFRMVLITEGDIRLDGVDISRVPVHFLRSRISVIPQDTVLFSGTVRDNLDPGKKCSDEELWSVLEAAQLKDLIQCQPLGLDSAVQQEGSNFSTGQSQLFCLARALLRRSSILVMDEATASLDAQTDAILQRVVASSCQHCTLLTIAHRISSITSYDRVLVLDGGRIAEDGKPAELLEQRSSLFSQLHKASQ